MFDYGLKQRMLLMLGISVLLVICGLVSYTAIIMRSEAVHSASNLAVANNKRYAALMEQNVDYAFSVARTVAFQFQAYNELPLEHRRSIMDSFLTSLYANNKEQLVDIWSVWEPNALDQRDADFINVAPGHDKTGRYVPAVSLGGLEPVIGYDTSGQDSWYVTPLNEKKEFASEPYDFTYANDNRTVKLLTLSVPIIKNNASVAVVGTDLDIDGLLEMVRNMRSDGSQSTLLTNTGVYLVADDEKNIGNKLAQILPDMQEVFSRVLKGETVHKEFVRPDNGVKEYIVYTPVRIGNTNQPWVLGTHIPIDLIMHNANQVAITILISGLGAFLLLMLLVYFIAKSIVNPLQHVSVAANEVAAGNLDFPLNGTGRKDELEVLVQALRSMIATIKLKINDSEEQSRLAKDESLRAHEATNEALQAQKHIELARERTIKTAGQLAALVEKVGKAVVALSESILHSEKGATIQAERLTETSTAMNEMYNTVGDVAKNASESSNTSDKAKKAAQEGALIVQQTVKVTTEAQQVVIALKEKMNGLGELAGSIDNIINVISDIADQTNLLALNAAIEAARAGEAGRGFAVVADEVRKLAEKTMQATKEVTSTIANINRGIAESANTVDDAATRMTRTSDRASASGEALSVIVSAVDATTEQIGAIAVAAQEQIHTCESVTRNINEISTFALETSNAMKQSANAVTELRKQNIQLQQVADDLITAK